MSVSASEKERWPAQSSFWPSLIMICVNCQAKAKEKKLDCSWSRLNKVLDISELQTMFQYVSILFTSLSCLSCFCRTDACGQPGSELLTRETASRVKKLKELFHKMEAQREVTSNFNGQDMIRPADLKKGSDWVGPVFCALILPWHWHVVSWQAASMCFHFAPLVRKLLVPKDEHGSKRVSCHEFQDNVDQHVKDELGKLQFPGSSIMLLLCFTRGSPLTT